MRLRPTTPADLDFVMGAEGDPDSAPFILPWARDASIALRLAGERPDLFRGVIGHEPPLFSLLSGDAALAPLLEEVN